MSENSGTEDIEKLKELVKKAKEIAESVPEKYQQDAFNIILKKLMFSQSTNKAPQTSGNGLGSQGEDSNNSLQKLLDFCQISKEQLKNVISIKKDSVDLVYHIKEDNESFQQVVGSLVVLLSHEILFNKEWVKSTTIIDALKKIGVQDRSGHFSGNLKSRSDLFLKNGNAQEFALTTGNGRSMASKIIGKLSKSEQVTKDDIK